MAYVQAQWIIKHDEQSYAAAWTAALAADSVGDGGTGVLCRIAALAERLVTEKESGSELYITGGNGSNARQYVFTTETQPSTGRLRLGRQPLTSLDQLMVQVFRTGLKCISLCGLNPFT